MKRLNERISILEKLVRDYQQKGNGSQNGRTAMAIASGTSSRRTITEPDTQVCTAYVYVYVYLCVCVKCVRIN